MRKHTKDRGNSREQPRQPEAEPRKGSGVELKTWWELKDKKTHNGHDADPESVRRKLEAEPRSERRKPETKLRKGSGVEPKYKTHEQNPRTKPTNKTEVRTQSYLKQNENRNKSLDPK